MEAPDVDACGVTFRFHETTGRLDGVGLVQEVVLPRSPVPFSRRADGLWELRFCRPPVRRFEYRFELCFPDGHHETVCDPANPLRAPGAFGDRSVIEFPDYRPPPYVGSHPPEGEVLELSLLSRLLGADQPSMLWSARGSHPATPLPVLVALDGIEFDGFSGLVRMLDWAIATRRLPPMRALLLHPTERNVQYSANPALRRRPRRGVAARRRPGRPDRSRASAAGRARGQPGRPGTPPRPQMSAAAVRSPLPAVEHLLEASPPRDGARRPDRGLRRGRAREPGGVARPGTRSR